MQPTPLSRLNISITSSAVKMVKELSICTDLALSMICIFISPKILVIMNQFAQTEKCREKNPVLCIKPTKSIWTTKLGKRDRALCLNNVISVVQFCRRQQTVWIKSRERGKKNQKSYYKSMKLCGKHRNQKKKRQDDKISLYILQQMYQQTNDRHNNSFKLQNGPQSIEIQLNPKHIDINQQEEPVGVPPQTMTARNRRYCKLQRLWKEGFFQEDSIMLNFPLLYYDYVGKYKKTSTISTNFRSMGDFLHQQLLHSQYRKILGQQLKNLKDEVDESNKRKTQESSNSPYQMDIESQQQGGQKQSQYEQNLEQISPGNLQLQQQALIQEIEARFLEGKINKFNYAEIDADESLDDWKTKELDEQQRYFSQMNQQQQQRDLNSNTGIQDF